MPACSKTVLHLILKHEFLGNLNQIIKETKLSVWLLLHASDDFFVGVSEQISNCTTVSIYVHLVHFTPIYHVEKVFFKDQKNLQIERQRK